MLNPNISIKAVARAVGVIKLLTLGAILCGIACQPPAGRRGLERHLVGPVAPVPEAAALGVALSMSSAARVAATCRRCWLCMTAIENSSRTRTAPARNFSTSPMTLAKPTTSPHKILLSLNLSRPKRSTGASHFRQTPHAMPPKRLASRRTVEESSNPQRRGLRQTEKYLQW